MKTTDKKRNLNPFLLALSSRETLTCIEVIRGINSNRELFLIAIEANNIGAREFALTRIQENKVLYEFCLNTDSPALYDYAKNKINLSEEKEEREKFLKYLNMKEMVEEEYDDVVLNETYFIAEAV